MNELLVGMVVIAVGLLVGLAGYRALRVVIAVLGAMTGLGIGARLAQELPVQGVSQTVLSWIGALIGAVLLAWLAYAFYQVAVLLGLASIGFAIGSGLMVALGFGGGWVTWLVGALLAGTLVLAGLVSDLPAVLLIVLTGLSGANLIVTGLMLLTGAIDLAQLNGAGGDPVATSWWWAAASLVVAVLCIVSQLRALKRSRAAAMRSHWVARPVG